MSQREWGRAREETKKLTLSCLDKRARFSPNWASLNGSESGGEVSAGSSSLPDPQFQRSISAEKERKNHAFIDLV
jgi:hypothetical protein